jgi:hypothetical protein
MKIQGRALRRYGELRAQIPDEKGKGAGRPSEIKGDNPVGTSAHRV